MGAVLALVLAADPAAWWTAAPACPAGTRLSGAPPPAGIVVACVDSTGTYHGRLTRWFPGGARKQVEGEYRRGVAHGQFTWWKKDGKRALAGEYWAGKKSGRWTRWNEAGESEYSEHPTYDRSDAALDAAIEDALSAAGSKSIDSSSSPNRQAATSDDLGGARGAGPAEELAVTAALGGRAEDIPDSDMGREQLTNAEAASPYVKRAVARASQAVDRCYKSSKQKPKGEVIARFSIAASGAVEDVRIVKSTLTGTLTECIKKSLAKLKLEPHDGPAIEVLTPWTFVAK